MQLAMRECIGAIPGYSRPDQTGQPDIIAGFPAASRQRKEAIVRQLLLCGVAVLGFSAPGFAIPILSGSAVDITGSDTATTAVSIDMATGLSFTSVRTSLDPATLTGSFAGA